MVKTLVKEKKYLGKCVALKSPTDTTVVAYGITYEEAYRKAQQKGYLHPVLAFIPPKDTVQIY